MVTYATPPSWYPDPTGHHQLRYWDGRTWSERVIDDDDFDDAPPRDRSSGWHPDPTQRAKCRFFDGRKWTTTVLNDEPVAVSEHAPEVESVRPIDAAEELAHLEYVRDFIERGRDDRTITSSSSAQLLRAVAQRTAALSAGPSAAQPVGASPWVPEPYAHAAAAPPAPTPAPAVASAAARAAPTLQTRIPTPAAVPIREVPQWRRDLTRWTGRTGTTIKSDLAVHGLAYLGVLLLFAGVFGFVAFAFGSVGSNWRPVAEVMIPVALFGSARFLRTRGAPFVAVALEALGGAVVPIVVIAAFVDGSDVPPDLTGSTLAFTVAGSLFAVAGVYAWITTRREGSPLRYLVAPVVWLGVAMGALVSVPAFHGGQAVARPQPASMAVTAVAVLVTAVLVQRSRHVLTTATDAVVLPGIAVVAGLEVAAAATHGWPVWPSFVTALAVFGVVEIERRRLGRLVTPIIEALAFAAALAALAPEIGWPWVGALGVLLFLAFGKWLGRRDASAVTLWSTLVPASAGLVVATGAPGAMVLAFASATVWAHTRRLLPVGWLPRAVTQNPIVALLPLGVAAGIFDALPLADATWLVAALLAVGAVAVRLSPARVDPLWTWWFPTASMAVLAIAVAAASEASRLGTAGQAWYPVALVLTGIAVTVSTTPAALRVWIAAASWAAAAIVVADLVDVAPRDVALAFAACGFGLVLAAALWRPPVMGHVGVIGHLATAAALGPVVLGGGGWSPVAVSALFAGAWLVTTAAQETVGSVVAAVFDRVTPRHGFAIAPVLASASLPFVAVAALVAAGAFPDHPESRLVVPFAVAAVVDALFARLLVGRVQLTTITARAAFAFALLGAVGGSDNRVGVVCGALAVVSIAVLPTTRRTPVMVWAGWALTALVAVRVGLVAGLGADGLRIMLFAWATGLTVGVLGYLRRSGTPRAALQPRFTDWWTPPLVLGFVASIAAVETGIDAAGAAHLDTAGWWLLGAAALTLVWALELAEPTVTYVSDALAAAALTLLLPWSLPGEPWGLFVVGLALTAVAIALASALPPTERPWWRQWDMPPFVVANFAAAAVVALAEFSDAPPAVYAAVGAWALGVGAWRRHWAWLSAAAVLLDTSAGRAGPGWLALALALTAVVAVVVALRARGPVRTDLQVVSAVCAAGVFASTMWWLDVPVASAVALGAPLAMIPVVGLAGLRRRRLAATDWCATWATVGSAALVAAAGLAVDAGPGRAGSVLPSASRSAQLRAGSWPSRSVSGGCVRRLRCSPRPRSRSSASASTCPRSIPGSSPAVPGWS